MAVSLCVAQDSAVGQRAAPTSRDTVILDSLFRAHRYGLGLDNGKLTGAGAQYLVDAARNTQFFVIGESHNVAEIPRITSALFGALHDAYRFNYYAVEYGPTIMELLSAPQLRGHADSTFAVARRFPHAFQFWNDQELEAMAAIAQRSSATIAPLWGLDNEWGALHVLDRLVSIAPNREARELTERLAAKAREVEATRPYQVATIPRYITRANFDEFDVLRAGFRARVGSEAAILIDRLMVSNRIYANDIAAGRGELTGYRANYERGQGMKHGFMSNYRAAQANGDSLPRVLLKFGNVHGGNWFTSTSQLSLGNFLHQFATANGRESFHLLVWLVNEPNTYWSLTDSPEYLPLANVGSTRGWTLVDLRPLRDYAHAGRVRAMSPQLRETVFAFDAVLLIGNGKRGSYERLQRR